MPSASSLPPGRTPAQCQQEGCTATYYGGGHYCSKHSVPEPRDPAATNTASGSSLPANSRLGTEFIGKSGKTARKGASRSKTEKQSNKSAASPGRSQESPERSISPRNTTPSMPPPMRRTRRHGSSPLKMAHSPPSDSESTARVLSDDEEVIEVEAGWQDESGTLSDEEREDSVDNPQYDPRLLVPKLVTRGSLPGQHEPVRRLLPSPQGMPLPNSTLGSKAGALHSAGSGSMPTPASGSFMGSPGGASRKRRRSPDPLAPPRRYTTRGNVSPFVSPYVHRGNSSREEEEEEEEREVHDEQDEREEHEVRENRDDRQESEFHIVPESPIDSSSPVDNDDHIETSSHKTPPGKMPPPQTPPYKTTVRLANGKLRYKLVWGFDHERFDSAIYGQDGASSPPAGVIPAKRKPPRMPNDEDGRLFLRIDPRIHWPLNWTDEWYEEKMKEIKARGNRKANFGKAAKRMREQRLKQEALAAAEAAGELKRRREPRPWGHRRHIDFSDVPEERLPRRVRANPAWQKACAWMRTNRVKTAQRDREVERLKAIGRSFRHLRGRTGW